MKKKTANKVTVGPLKDEHGNLVTEDSKMAGLLNSFFCSVFTKENTSAMPEAEKLYFGPEPITTVEIKVEKVKLKLSNLKPCSAPGLTPCGQEFFRS